MSKWTKDGRTYTRRFGALTARIVAPSDERFLPCSANAWEWTLSRNGRIVERSEVPGVYEDRGAWRASVAQVRAAVAELQP